jgi:hypothetical protein
VLLHVAGHQAVDGLDEAVRVAAHELERLVARDAVAKRRLGGRAVAAAEVDQVPDPDRAVTGRIVVEPRAQPLEVRDELLTARAEAVLPHGANFPHPGYWEAVQILHPRMPVRWR